MQRLTILLIPFIIDLDIIIMVLGGLVKKVIFVPKRDFASVSRIVVKPHNGPGIDPLAKIASGNYQPLNDHAGIADNNKQTASTVHLRFYETHGFKGNSKVPPSHCVHPNLDASGNNRAQHVVDIGGINIDKNNVLKYLSAAFYKRPDVDAELDKIMGVSTNNVPIMTPTSIQKNTLPTTINNFTSTPTTIPPIISPSIARSTVPSIAPSLLPNIAPSIIPTSIPKNTPISISPIIPNSTATNPPMSTTPTSTSTP